MKKAIKRFWGIGLIVIILSSFFMAVPVAPASGNIYAWAADSTQPTVANRLLAPYTGFGINDIAATSDGANIYIVSGNSSAVGANYLFKSTNGGVSWSALSASSFPTTTTANMSLVAVAPDDPNVVVIADQNNGAVYLSTNGGSTFSSLGQPLGATGVINDIAISAQSGPYKWIAAVGYNGTTPATDSIGGKAMAWAYGSAAPTWIDTFTNAAPPYAFAGTSPSVTANISNVTAVAFSSSFPSDSTMLITTVTNGGGTQPGSIALHAASFNIGKWDASVDTSYPRYLATSVATSSLTSAAASIALDPTFYMGDPAAQIGFIGFQATINGTTAGGVSRISTYSVTGGRPVLTQIMTSTDIGYVAWDGTNLAAAPYVATQPAAGTIITIYRSADSLSSSIPTFSLSSGPKTVGTGYLPKLLWNGGNLLAISRGTNSGIAKSTDLGKSFNGIALMNTSWAGIDDFQACTVCSSVIYVLANDGLDTDTWRYMNNVWQRIMIIPNTTATWLMRVAASDPTALLLGLKGGANMWISTDSGEFKWTARSTSTTIQDFAVESASVVYVAGTSNSIVKSTNGAFTWGPPVNTQIGLYATNNIYSISVVAAGKVMVGGTGGSVAYSTDSGATWTALPQLSTASTNVLAYCAGTLSTGDTIYATSSATSDAIYKWVIGTNAPPTNWTVGQVFTGANNIGLTMAQGVLYDFAATTNATYRFLTPGLFLTAPFYDTVATGISFTNSVVGAGKVINALQSTSTASSTTLLAVTGTTLYSWTEYLAVAANAPATTYPPNAFMVPVNSINGNASGLVFQWTQPPSLGVISSSQAYAYTVTVYLDSAGKVTYGSGTVAATSAPTLSLSAAAFTTPLVLNPGTTYYWRVKTTSPVTSQNSPMQTFTVQSLPAAVPAIVSPANGSTITNQTPAFSWAPVTGTTQYDFQLSTTPTFGTTVLTDQPNTAGDLVPVTIPLTQGKQYFWRVRALQPVTGDWSAVANFFVAAPTTTTPGLTITSVPAPVITIPPASPAPIYTIAPTPVEKIAPTYIWAIIIIGAILVIAVIVLIVRTRRSV
jgi:photosystem II stability/assembly factor-like uncharacterized protein